MSEIRLEFPTAKTSIEEVRPVLDQALHEEFPGGMMKSHWEGDVLQVGRDLQFIRINGTIVGGLVGVVIHAVTLVV